MDWKYNHSSPEEAYMYILKEYTENEELINSAKQQYREGYSIQDIKLGDRLVRFMICEDHKLLHKKDESKVLDFI